MIKNKKTILKRLFVGFNKGYKIPTLPENIIKIHNYPIIRIFRVLGGISTLSLYSIYYMFYILSP